MTSLASGPAYRVETDRLVIRCWSVNDAPHLRAALDRSDRYLRPWIPWMKDQPQSLDQTLAWIRTSRAKFDLDQDFVHAIFDRDERELLGGTSLFTRQGIRTREIGYWLTPGAAGKGVATEASAAMVRVAFEVDRVDRVEIRCAPENAPSIAIPMKLGFAHETTLKDRYVDSEGTVRDTMVWTLLAADYPASLSRRADIRAFDGAGRQLI